MGFERFERARLGDEEFLEVVDDARVNDSAPQGRAALPGKGKRVPSKVTRYFR
jgi:hypothetical protein